MLKKILDIIMIMIIFSVIIMGLITITDLPNKNNETTINKNDIRWELKDSIINNLYRESNKTDTLYDDLGKFTRRMTLYEAALIVIKTK